MDPIENGDFPASYVIVYQRVEFHPKKKQNDGTQSKRRWGSFRRTVIASFGREAITDYRVEGRFAGATCKTAGKIHDDMEVLGCTTRHFCWRKIACLTLVVLKK